MKFPHSGGANDLEIISDDQFILQKLNWGLIQKILKVVSMKMLLILAAFVMSAPLLVSAKTEYIWASIPSLQGADLCNFKDVYSNTRSEYIKGMIKNSSELLEKGATGEEVLVLLKEFDSLYDKHRKEATQGMDLTLEFLIKGNLENHFAYFNPRERRVQFRSPEEMTSFIQTLTQNQRSGYILAEYKKKIDYLAYGSYSIAANCRSGIHFSLNLVSTENGNVITFDAVGTPDQVTYDVARKLFDHFQKTKFPSTIKNADGSKLTIIGTPSNSLHKKVRWTAGDSACKKNGGRLPTADEIRAIHSYGDYAGGITIDNHNFPGYKDDLTFLVNESNSAYLNHDDDIVENNIIIKNDQAVKNISQLNAKTHYFFCVK